MGYTTRRRKRLERDGEAFVVRLPGPRPPLTHRYVAGPGQTCRTITMAQVFPSYRSAEREADRWRQPGRAATVVQIGGS